MDHADLAEALTIAESAATLREAAAALRPRLAPLKVVVMDAFDMRRETPAAFGRKRALFLGANDGHCWAVTADPAQAAGLFITDRA